MRFHQRRLLRVLVASLFLASGFVVACGGSSSRPASLAEWRQALELAEGVEVQMEMSSADLLNDRVHAAARTLSARIGKPVTVGSIGINDHHQPRIVIGQPSEAKVAALLRKLGFEIDGEGLRVASNRVLAGDAVLRICAADPERAGLPLQMFVALNPTPLTAAVEDLSLQTRPRRTLVSPRAAALDLASNPADSTPIDARQGTAAFESFSNPGFIELLGAASADRERAASYARVALEAFARLHEWTDSAPVRTLRLLVVEDVSSMRQVASLSDLTADDGAEDRRIVLLAAGVPDDGGASVVRWAAAQNASVANNWWLDAVAIDAANAWWGRPLEAWGAHLQRAQLVPSLEEIVADASVDKYSQHVLAPARALLCRYLRESRGAEWRRLWRGEVELQLDDELRAGFARWLSAPERDPAADKHTSDWLERRERLRASPFQLGVALDSNARLGGGFDGFELGESLREARAAQADALSITSYFTERPTSKASLGGRVPAGRTTLEGDAALAHAVQQARRAGIERVLLQPHLLLSESSGYSSWLKRTTPEHWDEFFDAYEPMLVHYALLSELLEVDLLCIGTTLSERSHAQLGGTSTIGPLAKPRYDAGWIASVELARAAYGGSLTFAAEWPREVSQFEFWDKLDFIGVSLFPTWASLREPPPKSPLLAAKWRTSLQSIDELSKKWQRPAVIVEMGVRSTELAATEMDVATGAADLAEQERVWLAFADALDAHRREGGALAGLYVWKWPAGASDGGDKRGFTVSGKPAESIMGRLHLSD